MSLVVVSGDLSTTVAVVLSIAWPRPSIVVEADPRGGVLASWFGLDATPSLSDAVTTRHAGILRYTQQGRCRVLIAPQRSIEASLALATAERDLFHRFVDLDDDEGLPIDVITDSGGPLPARVLVPGADRADIIVVTHRQLPGPRAAASVRLAQFAERIDALSSVAGHIVGIVIGTRPYGLGEIAAVIDPHPLYSLPVDRRSARLLAGRAGFVGRRRSRLIAAGVRVAESICADSAIALARPTVEVS